MIGLQNVYVCFEKTHFDYVVHIYKFLYEYTKKNRQNKSFLETNV